jgi:pSer/pThr/pTyr-binding forkhead associated (FHA) protein
LYLKLNKDDVFCVPLVPALIPETNTAESSENLSTSTSAEDTSFKQPAPPPVSTNKPQLKTSQGPPPPPLQYEKPEWSARPPDTSGENVLDPDGYCAHYFLEVLKNGSIVDRIKLNREFISFGRLDTCDVLCEHPSLSRYHAVLQYSSGDADNAKYPEGFYIYDLNSTHGTFVNKSRVRPNDYVRLNNDNIFKLGLSTRLFILHGPRPKNFSDDLNINLTHEQMKKVRDKYAKIALKLRMRKEAEEEMAAADGEDGDESASAGVSWGINDELEDELAEKAAIGGGGGEDGSGASEINPFSVIEENSEAYYADDPKKALKNFFEREGDELEYEVEELGPGRFKCRIRLPIVNNFGENIHAECEHHGKKKDCMLLNP